jgi:hypothetical protein
MSSAIGEADATALLNVAKISVAISRTEFTALEADFTALSGLLASVLEIAFVTWRAVMEFLNGLLRNYRNTST